MIKDCSSIYENNSNWQEAAGSNKNLILSHPAPQLCSFARLQGNSKTFQQTVRIIFFKDTENSLGYWQPLTTNSIKLNFWICVAGFTSTNLQSQRGNYFINFFLISEIKKSQGQTDAIIVRQQTIILAHK